ncbi:MAG: V-type ATP synthase subunit A, partial [Chloroflexi bacterium]|nr:V-type ATP synthase subunit A [Chloroflexota bacterium]
MGEVIWVNGPVVRAEMRNGLIMEEQVEIGPHHLVGEVISLERQVATFQVYEETSGLKPGDPVFGLGMRLSLELGPGLMGRVFDGIQRPLEALAAQTGDFIQRGAGTVPALDREKKWSFKPMVSVGDAVRGGAVFGSVPETGIIEHRLLIPPELSGKISWIAPEGEYTVDEVVARLEIEGTEQELTMLQRWAVREERPFSERLNPTEPLITGQRVIDAIFPIAKGGTACLPGGFGTGKTVLQHSLAKWSDADIVIYVGCGERGNEMTDVLTEFPKLEDPRSGRSLMERTILIANTSNMPVAAREASIYTGITMAEYYRDMGYDVALMADSTSRWAEALREISGRLEEMPAEEGFPAYLPSRLASFYERAGRVITLGGQRGSVTVIGAVSPPGGDFSEPVTQHTLRFTRVLWALDKSLAAARHFPAIAPLQSYSGYVDECAEWWEEKVDERYRTYRAEVMRILQQQAEIEEIAQLVGSDSLPETQRFILFVADLIEEAFLQQSALDPIDAFTSPEKQMAMIRLLLYIYERGRRMIEKGVPYVRLQNEVDIWP